MTVATIISLASYKTLITLIAPAVAVTVLLAWGSEPIESGDQW